MCHLILPGIQLHSIFIAQILEGMSTPCRVLGGIALLCFTLTTAFYNKCLRPPCSATWPPGHQFMGDAWWAIGAERFGAQIRILDTKLVLSGPPVSCPGIPSIQGVNFALENTVISTSALFAYILCMIRCQFRRLPNLYTEY